METSNLNEKFIASQGEANNIKKNPLISAKQTTSFKTLSYPDEMKNLVLF